MDEFSLINAFFKPLSTPQPSIIKGIGDDAACVTLPSDSHLLISTDTCVEGVHFLSQWPAYDIAWRAVMVNVSDIAAMGATPCWMTLALTLPSVDVAWLTDFTAGLTAALEQYGISLIGGDTTRGPLSITIGIYGFAPAYRSITRAGARKGDGIWVSGLLGGAALALRIKELPMISLDEEKVLQDALLRPKPRVDFSAILREFASAAIDISDGLSADLGHICEASNVGALLTLTSIPVHPLVQRFSQPQAISLAMTGGDDYELCFTIPSTKEAAFVQTLKDNNLLSYKIGVIEQERGLRGVTVDAKLVKLTASGYQHF